MTKKELTKILDDCLGSLADTAKADRAHADRLEKLIEKGNALKDSLAGLLSEQEISAELPKPPTEDGPAPEEKPVPVNPSTEEKTAPLSQKPLTEEKTAPVSQKPLTEEKTAPVKQEPTQEEKPAPTYQDVRKALASMAASRHGKEAREILKHHGAATLSALPEAEYAAVLKEVENFTYA